MKTERKRWWSRDFMQEATSQTLTLLHSNGVTTVAQLAKLDINATLRWRMCGKIARTEMKLMKQRAVDLMEWHEKMGESPESIEQRLKELERRVGELEDLEHRVDLLEDEKPKSDRYCGCGAPSCEFCHPEDQPVPP